MMRSMADVTLIPSTPEQKDAVRALVRRHSATPGEALELEHMLQVAA